MPAVLKLPAFAANVSLAWNANADPSIAGYNLYCWIAGGTSTNKTSAGNATHLTLSNLVMGATYFFAATSYNAAGLESPFSSVVSYKVPLTAGAANQPPTLNAINDLALNENAGLQTVNLSGISSGAANESQTLTVKAVSSNIGLIPNPTVSYTNANTTGKLTFTPLTNANGTATITITVNDGGTSNNIVTRTFTVTVAAVNNPPTLNALGNLSINENAGLKTVNLSGITSGAANENQVLTVTAVSSSTGLIPNPTVSYTNANTTGKLTFKPVTNAFGTATITVTVKDGGASNNIVTRKFTVTVTIPCPTLSRQLTNQAALAGQTKTFAIAAAGSGTLKYQWKFNGTILATATGSTLTLKNVNTNQSGIYSVTVTDQYGSTNSTAGLTVYATAAGTLVSAGLANGHYIMAVQSVPGCRYIVQATTNFVNWVPVRTNTAPFTFVDAQAGQFNRRFYRSVYAP